MRNHRDDELLEKPNVILLTIDSLRADRLSSLGYHKKLSRHMDDLSKEGVLFRQAVSNPNTPSSFPFILTSSYPRLHFSEQRRNWNWLFLSSNRMTLAEALKRNGYSTAAFHANPWISSFFHYNRGFDVFDDQLDKLFAKSILLKEGNTAQRIMHDVRLGYDLYTLLLEKTRSGATNVINKKAVSWLRNNSNKSFFLWLHYMDVHTPYIPLDSTITERLKAFRLFWKIWRNNWNISDDELKTIAHFYDREINYVDNEIGLFLNEINKMGISLDNTYIIITADHGDQLMEHGSIGHGFFYEEVIRVPLIICGPGIRKNVTVEDLVCLMDLGPTILDLLNVQKVDSFQGESLLPIMYEKKASKDAVILEGINSNSFAYRTNEWKYILMDNNSKDVSEELYNLRTDPKEKTNLVNEEKTKAKEFKSKIFDHIQIEMDERLRMKSKEKSVIPEQRMEEKEQIERRLRMLGYM